MFIRSVSIVISISYHCPLVDPFQDDKYNLPYPRVLESSFYLSFLPPVSVVRMLSLAVAVQVLSFSALAHAASDIFESLVEVPRGWTLSRPAQGSEAVRLRLSLKQQNLDNFYDELIKVSTPEHEQYGMHYEGHELRSLLAPAPETSTAAISWLQDNNITTIQDDGEYVLFQTNVEGANKLLDTEFSWYRNADDQEVLRTMQYSVPESIKEHINFVQPTTRFGTLKPLASGKRYFPPMVLIRCRMSSLEQNSG